MEEKIKIKIGISSCLLGKKVRWDGGHKHNDYITDHLGLFFTFVDACPELEVGMGIPREPVRLVKRDDEIHMVGVKTEEEWTSRIQRYSKAKAAAPEMSDLCGYIFKKDSPSCGVERVKVYGPSGVAEKKGQGMFFKAVSERHPLLPIEEEGRLCDIDLRENFIERVFAFSKLQALCQQRFSRQAWIEFHSRYKYLLMAHGQQHYKSLGGLVARIKEYPAREFIECYRRQFMGALKTHVTVKNHMNTMAHIYGYLKTKLTPWERDDLFAIMDDYKLGLVPRIVPITLLSHYIRKHEVPYVKDQIYLAPHPKELIIRYP